MKKILALLFTTLFILQQVVNASEIAKCAWSFMLISKAIEIESGVTKRSEGFKNVSIGLGEQLSKIYGIDKATLMMAEEVNKMRAKIEQDSSGEYLLNTAQRCYERLGE